ncbi:ATP-binding protein [Paenibacillus tarimensis]
MNFYQQQNRIASIIFGSTKHMICAAAVDKELNIRFATNSFMEYYKVTIGERLDYSTGLANHILTQFQSDDTPEDCIIEEYIQETKKHLFVVSDFPQEKPQKKEKTEIILFICDITPLQQQYHDNLREELLRLVGEMAAGTAHHILNPLAVIKGSLQLIKEKLADNETMASRSVIHRLNQHLELGFQQVKQIQTHIQRMIQIGKPFKMQLDIVDVPAFFSDFIAEVQKETMKGGCKLSCEFPYVEANIMGHPQYLKQALLELLANAIEASRRGGHIFVGVEITETSVIFQIRDEGGGIHQEYADRAKLPFYSTKENSLGLGLNYCDVIFRNMDAVMTIDSKDGQTSVLVTIPRLIF